MTTENELYDKKSIAVEPYAGGFILADYSGNRGEASYCGASMSWSLRSIVRSPFPTQEAAVKAGETA